MKKVMIVDDVVFIRNALRIILEKNGFEVVGQASDGKEAVAQYKSIKPDIVTMDITMPKMEGLEALQLIIDFDPKAIVVMVTAIGKEEIVRKAIKHGAKNYIIKPFNEQKVINIFSKL